jgi:hypothetical protein
MNAVCATADTCQRAAAPGRRAPKLLTTAADGRRRRPSLPGFILRSVYVLAIRRGRPETIRWPDLI